MLTLCKDGVASVLISYFVFSQKVLEDGSITRSDLAYHSADQMLRL
jgi:hypothetical protein